MKDQEYNSLKFSQNQQTFWCWSKRMCTLLLSRLLRAVRLRYVTEINWSWRPYRNLTGTRQDETLTCDHSSGGANILLCLYFKLCIHWELKLSSFNISFQLQNSGAKTCGDSRHYDGLYVDHWLRNGSRIFICYHHVSLTGLSNCSLITSSWSPESSNLGDLAGYTLRSSSVVAIAMEFTDTSGLVLPCRLQGHSFVFWNQQ